MENIQPQVEEPIENLTPEVKQAEEAALKVPTADEIRAKVIADYGLDEVENEDLVKKLVADKLEDQKRLSTAIGQKIKYRTKLTTKPADDGGKPKEEKPTPQSQETPDVTKIVQEQLDQRDLDSLELSPELKKEVKNYAKLNNISIKDATKSPYIAFLKKQEDDKNAIEEAAISEKQRKTPTTKDFSKMNPSDFDLSTKEGREEWDKYKAWLKTQK